MPELPEVEVTRLSLVDRIRGSRILAARPGKPLRWPLGCAPIDLVGRTVLDLRRRGKYLLMDLDQGLLLWHLGMSGSLSFGPAKTPAGPHDHFDLSTDHGLLRLHDPRRFGAVVHAASADDDIVRKLLGHLGPEPLSDDFDVRTFHTALHRRHTPIKQVLLAGTAVVGVGNIYACEALFLAGIRPTLRADRITHAQASRLHAAVREVMALAVRQGGSTLKDFSNADGQSGHFQLSMQVYGRAGQPCRICATPVRHVRQGQRSSYFCSHCQKA